MQLVLDIGNSSIKAALFFGDALDHTFQLSHEPSSLVAALDAEIGHAAIDRAGMASVVPDSTATVRKFLDARGIPSSVVTHAMDLPLRLDYATPETLGADRLAAAAAAWTRYGRDPGRGVVALDAGTALTFEVIDGRGVYRGGAIAPGPALMQRALNRETAQLPEVPLTMPAYAIGRTTVEAMQVGIMHGFLEGVRGLLRRINAALGEPVFVVATGGWSRFLRDHLEQVDAVEPHLVLHGVRLLLEMNPPSSRT